MRGFASIGIASVVAMAVEAAGQGDAWLSESERRRLAAITAPRRRAQFLAGRWSLRKLLAAKLGREPLDCVLSAEEDGPPRLIDTSACLRLSLSHSGDTVVCAVADGPVGIDVEVLDAARPSDGLMEAVLSPRERERIKGLSVAEIQAQFFAAWTLKEAWLKHAPAPADLGLASLLRIETRPASETTSRNAWTWSTSGFVLALVAPSVTVVRFDAGAGAHLENVCSAAWHVAPTPEVVGHGALG